MKLAYLTALAGAAFFASPAAAQSRDRVGSDLGLTFSTGIDYSKGDYGAAEDTKILVVPFSLRAKTGSLRFTATLPYLRIDGPGNIVGGGTGGPIIIDPRDPAPREVREGLGDLSLGGAYSLPLESFDVDLGARVKIPTSSRAERLGTGKTDFAVNLDVAKPIGNFAPFVNVSYRLPGDPDGINLRNTISTSLGSTLTAGSATLIGSYDYSQAASELSEDSHSLFGGLSAPLSRGLTITGYGTAGLSQGAPDFGAGLLVSTKIF